MARNIYQAAERAATLTRRLLAFSRQQFFRLQTLNLNDIVSETGKMLQRIIGEDVILTTSLAGSLHPVEVDRSQIEQTLLNLAVNARDAMPRGGRLTIETANVLLDEEYARTHIEVAPGPYVLLAVSDNGCGMDAATRARMFEPFFTTKAPGKGTGLGLAMVFGIVKQSGGHVNVYSEPQRGTTFKIYLPAASHATEIVADDKPRPLHVRGSETILVVEDEDMVRELAARILRLQGYTVLEAANGRLALETCKRYSGTIHLVLTDVVMPEMSGRLLAEELHAFDPRIKVAFMSGYTDDAVIRHGILDSASNFLQKPLTPTPLITKIREILDLS